MKKFEPKLDEEFDMYGTRCKCVKDDGKGCVNCVFNGTGKICSFMSCGAHSRKDDEEVIFVEVKNEKKTKHLSQNEQRIYMCAFRFVIRRVTSMAGIIMEEIEKVRDSMDFFYLCQIECETRYAFEQGLVDDYWKDKWEKFADELNEYLIEREKKEMKK